MIHLSHRDRRATMMSRQRRQQKPSNGLNATELSPSSTMVANERVSANGRFSAERTDIGLRETPVQERTQHEDACPRHHGLYCSGRDSRRVLRWQPRAMLPARNDTRVRLSPSLMQFHSLGAAGDVRIIWNLWLRAPASLLCDYTMEKKKCPATSPTTEFSPTAAEACPRSGSGISAQKQVTNPQPRD